jgi:hypothetical protein
MLEGHISVERMHQIITNCDTTATEAEEQHIQCCQECLAAFGELLLLRDHEDTPEA